MDPFQNCVALWHMQQKIAAFWNASGSGVQVSELRFGGVGHCFTEDWQDNVVAPLAAWLDEWAI